MRYTGPRNKIARREGIDLGLKTPGSKAHAALLRRINVIPGQTKMRRKRKQSERGKQLREKQKLRAIFQITEKQLKNYFKKAIEKKGNTASNLSQILEKRLDNVVYRLGFAPTRASARQLVNHGHFKVGDKLLDVSSYQVNLGEIVAFAHEKTVKIPYIEAMLGNKNVTIPNWLEKKGTIGRLKSEPDSEDIEKQVDLRSVIEYYSR